VRRPTSAWTELHTRVALLLVVAATGSLAGLLQPSPIPFWVATAVAITAVGALAFDAFGGVVVGLLVASGLVGTRRVTGHWEPDMFWALLLETAAVVGVGVIAGLAGDALRRAGTDAAAPSGLLEPVFGSLGLFDRDVALIRLEEEVERARDHRRALTLLLIETDVTDPALGPQARDMAYRAVARIVESRMRDDHVPFASDVDRLGAVMPETTTPEAWQYVGEILDAVTAARFMDRASGRQRSLAEAVEVHVGITGLSRARSSPDALLDAAAASLRRARADEEVGS
jgi:GGDEF domain-containing protein